MEKFCEEFLVDLNRTHACIRSGHSARSARSAGCRLMKDPRILTRINELMREREETTRVKAFKVLEELAVIAFSSIDHYAIDENGNVTVKADAPVGAMRAVSKIRRKVKVLEQNDTSTIVEYDTELTLIDKNPPITNALKHLGLLKEIVEHRDLTLEDMIRAAEAEEHRDPDGIETK
ncbi:MAG TPA: terminase small subunit [Gemmatimonadaceae bacterium]|nr:terminase small subunit [Gemmatimonadaceae bacterium]